MDEWNIKKESPQDPIILLLGSIDILCGNKTTIDRIGSYFKNSIIKDINYFKSIVELNLFIFNNNIQCIIAIHALRCAHILKELCKIPYSIILGGTDINEFSEDPNKYEIMTECLLKSKFIISFSSYMKKKFIKFWPMFDNKKIFIIPQAVLSIEICNSYDDDVLEINQNFFFIMIASIRPVKDPLYLLDTFKKFSQKFDSQIYLIIIGPEVDSVYSKIFHSAIKNMSMVKYIGLQSYEKTMYYLSKSFAFINSSVSEGMPISILEAMNLSIPVLARNQEGNASIVTHMKTGLLYDSPQDFLEKAHLLMSDKSLRQSIIENAKQMISINHNELREKQSYANLFNHLTAS